jgi:hypothetical protein
MGHWNGVVWIYFEDVFIVLSSTLVIDTPSKLAIYSNQTNNLLLNSPFQLLNAHVSVPSHRCMAHNIQA